MIDLSRHVELRRFFANGYGLPPVSSAPLEPIPTRINWVNRLYTQSERGSYPETA